MTYFAKYVIIAESSTDKQVIEELEKNGMITVDDLEEVPEDSIIIFRAHGEPEYKYEITKIRVKRCTVNARMDA